MIWCEEGSAGREANPAGGEVGDREVEYWIGSWKFWNVDEFASFCRDESLKKIKLQKRLEAAFDRHVHRMGFKKALELVAGGGICEVGGERANGGEQCLVDARTGLEVCVFRDLGPGVFDAVDVDLCVGRVRVRLIPGERRWDAHEWMQHDEDGFEEAVVGVNERDGVRRVGEFFGLHQ